MKKIIIMLISIISFNQNVLADSPLTSIEISKAYLNIPIVIKASKAKGELTVELMKYLKKKSNPIAIKIAIINELGLNAIGGFVDANSNFDSLRERVHRKNNASIFYEYLNKKKKHTTIKEFLNQANGDELICTAYLKAMDNYDVLDEALLFANKAKIKNPNSYTTHIICALIKAQQAMDTDWCLVYTTANKVRTNKELYKDMNQKAVNIIFEYMDLYKKDCEAKITQKSTMEDYKKAIALAEALMVKEGHILKKYNLVKLQNQFLYGKDEGMTASSVWEIIYKTKNTNHDNEYLLRGGEIIIEVDLKTQTAKITGWGE